MVGAEYLFCNLNCLATDGHLVIIGGNLSPTPLNLGQLIFKGASVTATMLRPRSIQQKADTITGVRRDVLPLVEAGALKPVIDSVVPMSDAAQAHTLLESGSTVGNVVLDNRNRSSTLSETRSCGASDAVERQRGIGAVEEFDCREHQFGVTHVFEVVKEVFAFGEMKVACLAG